MTTKNTGLVKDEEQMEALFSRILSMGTAFGFDIETGYDGPDRAGVSLHPDDSASKVVGFSFTNDVSWARYIPISHDLGRNFDALRTARALWKLLRSGKGVAHNIKFELRHLAKFFRETLWDDWTDIETGESYGSISAAGDRAKFTYASEVRRDNGYFPFLSDTLLELYTKAELPSYGLKPSTLALFGHKMADLIDLFPGMAKGKSKALRFNILELTPAVVDYACEDSIWCLAIHHQTYPEVCNTLIYKTEKAIVPILCEMEDFGIKYNWSAMAEAARKAQTFLVKLEAEIMADLTARVGTAVSTNLGSTKQIGDILYGQLGMPVTKRTGTGAPSTDAIALTTLAKKYPVVKKITQ